MRHSNLKLGALALGLTTAFAANAQSSASDKARIDALEKSVADLSAKTAPLISDPGLPLHGFLDVNYASTGGKPPADQKNGFRLGTFDIYLAPRFSTNVRGLVELAFEYGNDGGLGTDLERLQLGYDLTNDATLWFGRFHTPYGYWNTAFHHGAQIQTSVTRPRFIAFEDQGGIMPAHSVGMWLHGKGGSGAGRFSYDFFTANSGTQRNGVLDYNAAGYDVGAPSFGYNLGWLPMSGLTVGVHGLQQRVTNFDGASPAVNTGEVTLNMSGGYFFYEGDKAELIGEYYAFNNTDLTGGTGSYRSSAWFIQAGYQFIPRWTAYVRTEQANLNNADPYFTKMNSTAAGNTNTTNYGSTYRQGTVGLRYDLDPKSALKLQAEQIVDDGNAGNSVNWLRTQFSVRF